MAQSNLSAGSSASSEFSSKAALKLRLTHLAVTREASIEAMVDAVGRIYSVNSGQDIVRANEPVAMCHVLLGGIAIAYKLVSEGKRQIVRFAVPGDFLDLDGYVGGLMDHSVAALGSCAVGVIPHRALQELWSDHPDLALALWRHTLAETAVYREWVVNVGQRSGRERIAHLICEVFSCLHGIGLAVDTSGYRTFCWHATQQDLADATGMTSVHINRSLKALRERGLMEIKRDRVIIYDWLGLKNLAGFEPQYLSRPQHWVSGEAERDSISDARTWPAPSATC